MSSTLISQCDGTGCEPREGALSMAVAQTGDATVAETESLTRSVRKVFVVTPEGAKTPATTSGEKLGDDSLSPHPAPGATSQSEEHSQYHTSALMDVYTTANRSRVLSLNEKVEKESTATFDHISQSNEDDSSHADSSDEESSYFAKHLPSPKSGRRFSYSSNRSAPARTVSLSGLYNSFNNRSSDASLSFSDESDELPVAGKAAEPVAQLPSQAPDMQLQRITRVHSVSSLVSSDASNNLSAGVLSPQSTLSDDTTGTPNDPSVSAELSTVVASASKHAMCCRLQHQKTPNGHGALVPRAETFGGDSLDLCPTRIQYPSDCSPSMVPLNNTVSRMLPRQPQLMSTDQLSHWITFQHHCHHQLYGGSSSSKSNDDAFPFLRSNDKTNSLDETNDLFVYHRHHFTESGQIPDGMCSCSTAGNNGDGAAGGNSYILPKKSLNESEVWSNESICLQRPGWSPSSHAKGFCESQQMGKGDGKNPVVDTDSCELQHYFSVYRVRWVLLFYMSILNLLSGWTCYSVAPISILTEETFGNIDPEYLVVIFLGANAVSTAFEPIMLARLGLKKTVLFGALLLMLGSVIKSGGIPPVIQVEFVRDEDEWHLYIGFFLIGLSQPLYQCTSVLLSASWFPDKKERTMASGIALNANQLGIGFAFIFGILLVTESDDIPAYFGLLSVVSTLAFLGTLFQFQDVPLTLPAGSAKIIRDHLVVSHMGLTTHSVGKLSSGVKATVGTLSLGSKSKDPAGSPKKGSPPTGSHVMWETKEKCPVGPVYPPVPMMSGFAQQPNPKSGCGDDLPSSAAGSGCFLSGSMSHEYQPGGHPGTLHSAFPSPQQYYQGVFVQSDLLQQHFNSYQQQSYVPLTHPHYSNVQGMPAVAMYNLPQACRGAVDSSSNWDGAEPVVQVSDHQLEIDIRGDHIILSTCACLSRPGFFHALVSFTMPGIVINTLSTFMDYLVTQDGAGRKFVGVVGGSFQFLTMFSNQVVGKQIDKTHAHYTAIIAMLVLGAFGLAECGLNLDAERESDLWWSLLLVGALVGPLQPVSTQLGVDVAYPLSEVKVVIIQQLFSNLSSAIVIPFFRSFKDVGNERSSYAFSFYLLILLQACSTVFFSSSSGRYLRHGPELHEQAQNGPRKTDGVKPFDQTQGDAQNTNTSYFSVDEKQKPPLPSHSDF